MFSCCCGGCNTFADDFSTDNLATDYNQVAGTWTVSSGKLRTSSGSALILANTTTVSNYHTVSADVVMSSNGDSAKVLAGYLDANNYLYSSLAQNAANVTAKLYKRVAGVDTQIGPTRTVFPGLGIGVFPGGPFSVQICCGPDVTAAYFGGAQRVESDNAAPPGPYVGFATGTVGSSVTFDNLQLSKHRADSESCIACGDCLACIEDNGPYEMQLEAPADLSCAAAIGTFVGAKFAGAAPSFQACDWFAAVPGGSSWNVYALTPSAPHWDGSASPGTYRLRAVLGQFVPTINIVYEKDYGSDRIDCLNLSSESLPWIGEPGSVGCTSSTHAPVIVSRV